MAEIKGHFDGLVKDCSISSADALEILQSCTKPSTYGIYYQISMVVFYLLYWSYINSICAYMSSYPGYFWEPYWFSMGLPEISRVTWQVCKCTYVMYLPFMFISQVSTQATIQDFPSASEEMGWCHMAPYSILCSTWGEVMASQGPVAHIFDNFTGNAQDIKQWNGFENCIL